MTGWDRSTEQRCTELVTELCDTGDETRWHLLLALVGPHIEGWAASSWVLRRWRLDGPDDARTVLVEVLGRLRKNGFANLHRFKERAEPPAEGDPAQTEVIGRLARIATEPSETDTEPSAPAAFRFRGWLLKLVSFAVKDHVRHRMGWAAVSGSREGGTKRDIGTDAPRLDNVAEAAERPPITDFLTVRGLLDEIDAFAETFPTDMRAALKLWTEETDYPIIADQLGLADAAAARKLVRAAHARLREKFRGRWTSIFGE
jgi:hypothetical protein